ncbi:MAG: hypothetical protein RTU63_07600 [Candidatus Thorarchaeota archaeon]
MGLFEAAGGMVFSIFTLFIFCYLMVKSEEERKRSEEKEWERIEGSSATARKAQTTSPRSPKPRERYRYKKPNIPVDHRIPKKKPIPGVAHSIAAVKKPTSDEKGTVRALRGGEFIGNRMRFKVKVLNETQFIISDVTIFLISYPKEALRLDQTENDAQFPKIEPGGFRSPTFDFLPTQDCVRGEIVAGVSYIDERGNPHVLNTNPFVIRSVCDLLLPDQIGPEDFAAKLEDLHCGELVVKVESWTPEEMHEKALRIMEDANFYEVQSNLENREGIIFGKIDGLAKGKYTGKSIGVQILISGPSNVKGASCTLKVSGEDQAMILPAIDDLRERLSAWLCPLCGSPLTLENVEHLKDGKAVVCPFCNVPIGR